MKTTSITVLLLLSLALPSGATYLAEKVTAELQSKNGSQVSGQVDFFQTGDEVEIKYKIKNLRRNKDYVLHINESAECSVTGTANPLPTVKSNKRGSAEGSLRVKNLSVSADKRNTLKLLDRTVSLHTPSSSADATGLACGEIKSTVK